MSKWDFLFDLQLYCTLDNFSGDMRDDTCVYFPSTSNSHGEGIRKVPVVVHSKWRREKHNTAPCLA